MGVFNRKQEQKKFKATLTYGGDVVSLYEESKRLDREAKVWRDRIYASAEWETKEKIEEQQRAKEKEYEILIGNKYGFDPTQTGTYMHIRDYMQNYNKCEPSPFGFHATVWIDENREEKCIFCKKDL